MRKYVIRNKHKLGRGKLHSFNQTMNPESERIDVPTQAQTLSNHAPHFHQ